MTITIKRPPILPITLRKFVGYGFAFCIVVPAAVSLASSMLSSFDLIPKRNWGVLYEQALRYSLIAAGSVVGLWLAAYWSCWPYLFWGYLRDCRDAQEQARVDAAEQARTLERAQIAEDDAVRRDWLERVEANRREEAQSVMAARLSEVERQVLLAYAQHAVEADFFGNMPEFERLKSFAERLRNLGIHNLGILHHSTHPTVKKLVACAPAMPMVELQVFYPPQRTGGSDMPPFYTPRYNPFLKAIYSQPRQTLRRRFRNKLFSLRLPFRSSPHSS